MTPEQKIRKARCELIKRQPFFGVLSLYLELQGSDSIEAMATDGKRLYYNSAWVLNEGDEILKSVVAHEVLHCAFLHMTRRQHRDAHKWNVACDHVVNLTLSEDGGFKTDDRFLMDYNFKGLSAEAVYNKLPDCPKGDSIGVVIDGAANVTSLNREWKGIIAAAAAMAKQAGKLPGFAEEYIDSLKKQSAPWRVILERFVKEVSKSDFSWRRLSRRTLASNIWLPGTYSETLGTVVICIDTSASIDRGDLECFYSAMHAIINDIKPLKTITMYFDTTVQAVEEFTENSSLTGVTFKGRGGTDFYPVFKKIEKDEINPHVVVFLTDLCAGIPPEPDYPVIWAVVGDEPAPEWGEVVRINNNG